jgi:hypothetical protein
VVFVFVCDAFCSVENILCMQNMEVPRSGPEAPWPGGSVLWPGGSAVYSPRIFSFVHKLSYASRIITCDTDLLHPTMA